MDIQIISHKCKHNLIIVEEHDEIENYDDASWKFDTDYDRENPITRTFALKKW